MFFKAQIWFFFNESYTIRTDKLKIAVYSLCDFQKKLKKENEKIHNNPLTLFTNLHTSSH